MHAYLIIGKDPEKINQEIKVFSKKMNSLPIEFTAGKIEEVRQMNSFLKLSQPKGTIILIKDIENASTDALNAFLKNLEEPVENVTFLLTSKNEFKVLPTITSRCQVIRLAFYIPTDSEATQSFLDSTLEEKFKLIEKITKKEEAVVFLQNIIYYLHSVMRKGEGKLKPISEKLILSQETLDAVNQNGNLTLQMLNFTVKMNRLLFIKAS